MTLVIGLTGGIATGKSTVSNMFQEFDIPVIDADQLSRDVVEPGQKAYEEIVRTFGERVLHDNGEIDRKALGSIIFKEEEKRKQLNAIVHPEVRKEMVDQRDRFKQENRKAVVLDIPLLFESELMDYVDRILVVYVDEKTQLERLMERDQSAEKEAMQRIQSQIPISSKRERADEVIDNTGTINDSFKQLEDILHRWDIV
ncbi:dephospho-CoA kinase [Halobacillus salinus]|uniref:Dephospho-CoA kinase n=1 Tax=Halobacillus salinus TaxID=192814 RepID=A0A4Z0H2B1_9BACI|nr:dephospho-CoA kinase [Halobacillus salinus]TGB04089.1 dephospho-CoA kinase [Halobacillus salinus]